MLQWNLAFYFRGTKQIAKVFLPQKRIIRIMTGSSSRKSRKPLFQKLELLTMSLQYIISPMWFLSQNLEIYTFNSIIHCFNTQNKLQLHKLSTTLTIYQKGAYYDSKKIFNKLPKCMAELVLRKKCFVSNLKKYLIDKAFYSIEEYMNSSI